MGTILGPVMLHIFYPEAGHLTRLTGSVIAGVIATLAGIAIIGIAGHMKSSSLSEEEKKAAVKDFNFPKGIAIALLAGLMSGCFNVGLEFGSSLCFDGTAEIYKTPACDNAGDLRRFPDELRILPLPEFQKQFLEGLCQCQSPRRQRAVLRIGRNPVVQPVLRTQSRKRILERVTGSDYICILYIDGAQCHFLECLGYNSQRMERLLEEDSCCACGRNRRTHFIDVPA